MGICSVIGPTGDKDDIGPVGETGIGHEIIIDETKTINPDEPAKVINNGIEIYEVSNQPFLDGVEYNKTNKFPPVILITCNNEKYLIIEGHSRMTIYGFNPSKLNETYAYVGYTTDEEMRKYDQRMLTGEEVRTRKY